MSPTRDSGGQHICARSAVEAVRAFFSPRMAQGLRRDLKGKRHMSCRAMSVISTSLAPWVRT